MTDTYTKKHSVLIIDDSSFQRNMLSIVCMEAGFHTVLAKDGEEALSILEQKTFNLIITDLEMPRLDGIQLLREMGKKGTSSNIILVSGHPESVLVATKEMARECGLHVVTVMRKPYVPEDFLRLLKSTKIINPRHEPSDRFHKQVQAFLSPAEVVSGLQGGAIIPFYQPQVCHEKRRLVGFECLARWKLPNGDILGPISFIPTAEENGLMPLLSINVLEAAFKDLSRWNKKGRELAISVNISTDNLKDSRFPDKLSALSQKYGVRSSSIILEVTESKVMEETTKCLEVMSRIRMKGYGLSIDDFGTGYASLKQLQYCPFTELKLDQSYVAAAVDEKSSRSVLQSGIQLAQSLSLSCIAEGVETEEQAALLNSLGCKQHQGYLYSSPMPGDQVLPWVQQLFKQENEYIAEKNCNVFAVTHPDERTPTPSSNVETLKGAG